MSSKNSNSPEGKKLYKALLSVQVDRENKELEAKAFENLAKPENQRRVIISDSPVFTPTPSRTPTPSPPMIMQKVKKKKSRKKSRKKSIKKSRKNSRKKSRSRGRSRGRRRSRSKKSRK